MKLQEAVLCIDCELLYSHSNHCPQCGSQVSYPLDRALNRSVAPAGPQSNSPTREMAQRARAAVEIATRVPNLLQSA